MNQTKAILIRCVTSLLALWGSYAFSQDHIEVKTISNFDFGTYIAAGSVFLENTHCISSADTQNPQGKNGTQYPYKISVTGAGGTSEYFLHLNGNTSETGNRRLAIGIYHSDVFGGSAGYHQLSNAIYETANHLGQYRNCVINGNNSKIKIEISSQDLSGIASGTYFGSFSINALGGFSGTAVDNSISFSVSITVQSSSEVQISSLDSFDLGSYSGGGNISTIETFCIYSSAINGAYNISITSSNQDASGNFNLKNNVTSEQINYVLRFIDNGFGTPDQLVSLAPLSGSGNTSSTNCNGQDNAQLSVSISENNLAAASSGIYSDTLTLLVQPE